MSDDVNTGIEEEEIAHLCQLSNQIVIAQISQPLRRVKFNGQGLLLVEGHPNSVEPKCSTAAAGVIEIPSSVLFYSHISNLSAKNAFLHKK